MAADTTLPARPADQVGRVLYMMSYGCALMGGFIMSGIAAMVVVSVFGRWFFSKPIFGDFEMVALGTAVSVFLFLPYCHMRRGNVIVDLFLSWAPQKVQRFFDALGALALAFLSGLLAWRMSLGGWDMFQYNDMSYILAMPLWWPFPFAVTGFALLSLCCLYTMTLDLKKMIRE